MKSIFAWVGIVAFGLVLIGVLGFADVRLCVGAVGTCNGPTHTASGGK